MNPHPDITFRQTSDSGNLCLPDIFHLRKFGNEFVQQTKPQTDTRPFFFGQVGRESNRNHAALPFQLTKTAIGGNTKNPSTDCCLISE